MNSMPIYEVSSLEIRLLAAYLSGALANIEIKPITFDEMKIYDPPMPSATGKQRKSKGERKRDGWKFK